MMKPSLIGLAACFLLAACGGGSRSAPQLYALQPGEIHAPSCRAPHAGIKIYEPNAAPGLESFRVMVIDRPNHQTQYRGVGWNTTLPRAVQAFFTEAFETSGMFRYVSTDSDSIKAPWILETRLRGLHVDQSTGGRSEAVVQLTFTLMRAGERTPVMTVPLTRRDDVSGLNMDGIVGVFNRQLGDMASEVLQKMRRHTGCR